MTPCPQDFVFGNIIFNAGIVGVSFSVSVYFIKKWMNDVNTTAASNKKEALDRDQFLANSLKEDRESLTKELREYRENLNVGLNKIYDQMRIANGRTSKNEVGIAEVKSDVKNVNGKIDSIDERIGKIEDHTFYAK